MKKVLFITISVFTTLFVNAQDQNSWITEANNFYKQNKFQEAIDYYEKVLNSGYESSELYYNLGNAYYKQNVIAKAILNYEKALLLNPNNEDAKYNLELTNRMVVDKIETLPVFFLTGWVKDLKNLFSSDMWAIISISCFAFALVFISFFLYSRGISFKKLSFWIGFTVLIISVISFIFSNQQKQKVISGKSAIIMSPSVTIKSSPDASGTDLFVLHEGTKVWIEDKISDWNQIKLSDGTKGWLKLENIEII